ncbi:comF family protein [Epibacterium ulvae]|uniref:ComF family protein n=2 Tax=Epibacterium ulvae TaxID=1156985 RepID=A0A1G5RFV5_9RHOB|nr:comF family protein [Epibacterium ulvae]
MMMHAQIQTAVSLVYPPQCLSCDGFVGDEYGICGTCWREMHFIGGTVCQGCGVPLEGEDDGYRLECDDCLGTPRPWSQGRAALMYEDRAKQLVMGLKHGDRTDVARAAAGWMYRAARSILQDNPIVTPVPLHWTRMLRRKYNQSELLARAFAEHGRLDYWPDLLRRRWPTPSLDRKSRDQRYRTMKNAIAAHSRHGELLAGRTVILIDDVMTSGATLAACTEACLRAGAAEVRVVVLARVAQKMNKM